MRIFVVIAFFISLSSCRSYQQPIQSDANYYRVSRSYESNDTSVIQTLIAPYKENLDLQMNEIIGQASTSLEKQQPECKLGNWIADAIQERASKLSTHTVDASIQNYGGIRIPELAKGAISLGKMYEVMPFDNILVIVKMKGDIVQRFFDQMALDGGWPVSESVRYLISTGKAKELTINHDDIDHERTYYIAMPDYIANGNGGCGFLANLDRQDTGVLIRDVLIETVQESTKNGSTVSSDITGRVKY